MSIIHVVFKQEVCEGVNAMYYCSYDRLINGRLTVPGINFNMCMIFTQD